MRALLTSAMLCLTVAAAHAADTVSPTDVARIKTITVVSAIGDEVRFHKTGEFRLSNRDYAISIADWDLNHTLAEQVQKSLGGQFRIKYFSSVPNPFKESIAPFDRPGAVEARLHALPADPDADAYLVITEVDSDDYILHESVHGLDVIKVSAIFSSAVQMYANYDVTLIDAHTFRTIAYRKRDLLPPERSFRTPQDIWADSSAEMSSEQAKKLRTAYTTLMTGTLDETLRQMNLAR